MGQVLGTAIDQLSGQGRARQRLLAHDLLATLDACLGMADGQLGNLFARRGILAQPVAERVLGHPGDEQGGLARAQPLLGLTGELGIADANGEDIAELFPDIVRGQADPARQQFPELAKFSQRFGQAGAQPRHVRAALRGRYQVGVAFL